MSIQFRSLFSFVPWRWKGRFLKNDAHLPLLPHIWRQQVSPKHQFSHTRHQVLSHWLCLFSQDHNFPHFCSEEGRRTPLQNIYICLPNSIMSYARRAQSWHILPQELQISHLQNNNEMAWLTKQLPNYREQSHWEANSFSASHKKSPASYSHELAMCPYLEADQSSPHLFLKGPF